MFTKGYHQLKITLKPIMGSLQCKVRKYIYVTEQVQMEIEGCLQVDKRLGSLKHTLTTYYGDFTLYRYLLSFKKVEI